MARLARIVVSTVPHHVTQRGNRRQTVFFGDGDYQAYLALLTEHTRKAGVAVWKEVQGTLYLKFRGHYI